MFPFQIVAGRMAMLITLLLVLINFFTSITRCACIDFGLLLLLIKKHLFSNMPSTDGITAIAAWMLSCVFFVFCALMAYAYLLWHVLSKIVTGILSSRV